MLNQLQEVLDLAHAGHVYVTDQQKYGVPEHWRPGLIGDCEDFALWCRAQLAAKGIASNLVYCLTETGEEHLVCSTDDGWVLDNRYRWVMRRDDLDYQWESIGQSDGSWHHVS